MENTPFSSMFLPLTSDETSIQLGNFQPAPFDHRRANNTYEAKTWCRASEPAPAVVTFQTFYRGDSKTLKNETLASGAISSPSSSSPSSSSFTYP